MLYSIVNKYVFHQNVIFLCSFPSFTNKYVGNKTFDLKSNGLFYCNTSEQMSKNKKKNKKKLETMLNISISLRHIDRGSSFLLSFLVLSMAWKRQKNK